MEVEEKRDRRKRPESGEDGSGTMKNNCWEIMGCERGPGGRNAAELGVCTAATEKKMDGVHGGKNGGRSCWVLAGTLCGGTTQGAFVHKFYSCEKCDFYKEVRHEEGEQFLYSPDLLAHLRR
jgi:hypothetical protein